jgi:DUF971 family protein
MNMPENIVVSDCPSEIRLCDQGRSLSLTFIDESRAMLSALLLRRASPSAEGSSGFSAEKRDVTIIGIEPVGNYAVTLVFDDGHRSGIYSWQRLRQLAQPTNVAGT